MMNFYESLVEILKQNEAFLSDDGEILKNAVFEAAYKNDPELLMLLYSNTNTRERFFKQISDEMFVFNAIEFGWVISNREFLPDSYTRFANHIGLIDEEETMISKKNDVVLSFPYKDCILEGGQTKEDQDRNEIFYNEILAPDDIDVLMAPKCFTNAVRQFKDKVLHNVEFRYGDNIVIKGNNLLTISSLLKVFENKIKCIYIDPPYNAPGDHNTFSYNNTFNRSSWLTFMKNRLEISRRLLSQDGTMCMAIDDNEYAHLKVLCDELFGLENYISTVVIKSNPSGVTSKSFFARCHEYALLYAKDINYAEIGMLELNETQAKAYTEVGSDGVPYKWRDFMRTGGTSTPEERPNSYYPIYWNAHTDTLSLEDDGASIEIYPVDSMGKHRVWRQTKPSFLKLIASNSLKCTQARDMRYRIRIKDYIKGGMKPITIWDDSKYSATHHGTGLLKKIFNGEKVFSYPKSINTVKDMIKLLTGDSDYVLDFFGGSGTTAHAVISLNKEDALNRHFIICEQMDYVKSVTCERIKRVLELENSDEDFIYCELAKNNQKYMDQIIASTTDTELEDLYHDISKSPFISTRVDPTSIEKESANFYQLNRSDKKKLLMRLLDLNMLYINKSDIDDVTYAISKDDRTFNCSFYGEL